MSELVKDGGNALNHAESCVQMHCPFYKQAICWYILVTDVATTLNDGGLSPC